MRYKVVKACIDQDSKKKLRPGDAADHLSDFERGRHLAEGNIVPDAGRKVERSVRTPAEVRKKNNHGKTRKKSTEKNKNIL